MTALRNAMTRIRAFLDVLDAAVSASAAVRSHHAPALADLRRLAPKNESGDATAELSLLLDHVPGREGQSVADPYFGEDDGFDVTWTDVAAGAAALAEKLRRRDR
mgnify:CR=1 FL=1